MDRRDFLKTVAITGAALTIQRSEAMEVLTQTINKANGSNPDLVAVMGGEPEEMFRRAIMLCDYGSNHVSRGGIFP